MPELLTNLVLAIASAIVSALITVHLALKRFRAERWWERKADAYSAIIEALHHMKRGIGDDLRGIEQNRPPPDDERDKELTARYAKASDEVHKAADLGSFLLSDQASEALKELMDGLRQAHEDALVDGMYPDAYIGLSGQLKAIEKCLAKLPQIAKRDLSVR
jgi:hypothetical protein